MPRPIDASDEEGSEQEEQQEEQHGKNPQRLLQQMFLQVFLARRTMTDAQAARLYAKCAALAKVELDNHPTKADVAKFIGDLDTPLTNVGLSIKNRFDQETEQMTWTLLNDYSDEPSKLATEYNAQELAFYRIIVKKIMTASKMAYAIKLMDAKQFAKTAGLPTFASGQNVIASFVAKGWLHQTDYARLTLSHRARFELKKYLRETFEDDEETNAHERSHVNCSLCIELVTVGWACPNDQCTVRLHRQCTSWLNGHNGKCPGETNAECGQQWPRTDAEYTGVTVGLGDSNTTFQLAEDDGEGVPAEEDDEDESATQKKKGRKSNTSAAAGKKGKGKAAKGKRVAGSDDDEDEEMEEEEEEEAEDSEDQGAITADIAELSQAIAQVKRSSRGKPVKGERDEDEMEE
ncbi:hypothetical protein RQP46_004515 [Phenoliferia psychrophenolica]